MKKPGPPAANLKGQANNRRMSTRVVSDSWWKLVFGVAHEATFRTPNENIRYTSDTGS